jgi:hypothetical protein
MSEEERAVVPRAVAIRVPSALKGDAGCVHGAGRCQFQLATPPFAFLHLDPGGTMSEIPQSHPEEYIKVAVEVLRDAEEEGDEPNAPRRVPSEYDPTTTLTYAELVELWHHEHTVAMHKERLYVPASLAILVSTILGWKDLSTMVVALGAVASVGLYWYLVLIMEDFAKRQNRFYAQMQKHKSDVIRVMFDESTLEFKADRSLSGSHTVQRKLRRPFVGTLLVLWSLLILIKAGAFR